MRIGSLFSGIGGLELGLERSGLGPVVWQVEVDDWCRKVLARHWPDAERFSDVRHVGSSTLAPVDVICGGFPCTDLSSAARGVARHGLQGAASGLWWEFARIVGEMRPSIVVVENVALPWRQWLPDVRRSLWDLGFASVPVRMRAADVGLPHGRSRVFVAAYADRDGERIRTIDDEARRIAETFAHVADWEPHPSEPVGVANGIPAQMDRRRLKALGNAVVPQCAEVIGRAIVAAMGGDHA